jgi:hypothetical protein
MRHGNVVNQTSRVDASTSSESFTMSVATISTTTCASTVERYATELLKYTIISEKASVPFRHNAAAFEESYMKLLRQCPNSERWKSRAPHLINDNTRRKYKEEMMKLANGKTETFDECVSPFPLWFWVDNQFSITAVSS